MGLHPSREEKAARRGGKGVQRSLYWKRGGRKKKKKKVNWEKQKEKADTRIQRKKKKDTKNRYLKRWGIPLSRDYLMWKSYEWILFCRHSKQKETILR